MHQNLEPETNECDVHIVVHTVRNVWSVVVGS